MSSQRATFRGTNSRKLLGGEADLGGKPLFQFLYLILCQTPKEVVELRRVSFGSQLEEISRGGGQQKSDMEGQIAAAVRRQGEMKADAQLTCSSSFSVGSGHMNDASHI